MNNTMKNMRLDDKIILIIGGAGLIGAAVSEICYELGATVYIADISLENAENVKNRISSDDKKLHSRQINIMSQDDLLALLKDITKIEGEIHGVVNCAYPRKGDWAVPLEELDLQTWSDNIDLQLTGSFIVAKTCLVHLKNQGNGGSFVHFGSIYGAHGPDFSLYEGTNISSPAPYFAIKGGIHNFTKYLAKYFGIDSIRVNCVAPGGVFDHQDPKFVKKYVNKTPLGRMANPEDVGYLSAFLLSDAASYITGQVMFVDGGWGI